VGVLSALAVLFLRFGLDVEAWFCHDGLDVGTGSCHDGLDVDH